MIEVDAYSQVNARENIHLTKISLFGYNRWESVRTLRESFGYCSLTELFAKARNRFNESLPYHRNKVITHLAQNLRDELTD